MAGDSKTGISLMQMDEGVDTGPVYVQGALVIGSDETAASLHDRLAELGAALLAKNLDDILHGRIKAKPQTDAPSTYAPMIKKNDGRLDWDRSSSELDRHIRAMTPWPGAFTSWHGENIKMLAANPTTEQMPPGQPGQVLVDQDAVFVLTTDGGLELDRLQLAGKKAMSAIDFVRGRPDFAGSVLGN